MNALSKLNDLSLRTRILFAFIIVLCLLAASNAVQIFVFVGYVKQYNGMMETITLTNSINGVLNHQLEDEIRDIVYGKVAFESGKQYELLEKMNHYLNEIEENDSKGQFRSEIGQLRETLITGNEYIDKLGEQIKHDAPAEQKNISHEYMIIVSELIDEQVEELLLSTLKVSEKAKLDIELSLKRDISLYIAAFSIVIMFSVLFALFISKSIVKPIRQLRQNANDIADGNLTVNAVVVTANNEIGDLCRSYNRMSNNLKEIIQSVRDTNDEVMISSKDIHQSLQENRMAGEEVANATQKISINLHKQDELINSLVTTFDTLYQKYHEIFDKFNQAQNYLTDSLNTGKLAHQKNSDVSQIIQGAQTSMIQVSNKTNKITTSTNELDGSLKTLKLLSREIKIILDSIMNELPKQSITDETIESTNRLKQLVRESDHVFQHTDKQLSQSKHHIAHLETNFSVTLEYLDQGNKLTNKVKQNLESILHINSEIDFQINSVNNTMKDSFSRMETVRQTFGHIETHSRLNKDEVVAIAAMGEEQLATLEEVSEASSKQVERIKNMESSIRQFKIK
ncbi:methyl-accepting chemotaxis protein [Aquibacillus koreensis]|uniref:Methyl-accepting chemotaxis protein n=1 Tax=Aquibacillus koreensis TaxID=279446 RepID=A0A9X3WKP8_9BACI|nr:methyl-accepting chemotaxis protein [Aquibacillus koreensis]MCT2537214.1 methyl-accepting chemotaxis protein [Aquibacillus koreensis]MDC3421562.1 methyl-accepting chemotaxis protein [Aquibacillus koreensis]